MSRINDLIAEHCPNGVEFKPLGKLGKRNKGTSITAGHMKSIQENGGPVRIFAGGQTIADVPENSVPAKDVVRVPSIIVKSRGHIGFTYYDRPFTHKAELWSYSINRPDVDQLFVYYYLLTKVETLQKIAQANSVKLPQLGVSDTDTLGVPVPPLEVQREIVKVLDTFTKLEADLEEELKAELEARRQQYTHYRDALLTFDERIGTANQRTSEPANQRTSEPANQRTSEPANQRTANQRTSEPANQRTSEPANQRTSEPANQRTSEPANQRTSEPANQRTSEPANQRTSEPANQRTSEPANQRTSEPANQRTSEPANQRTSEPANQRTSEPANQRTSEPANQRTSEPANQRTSEPANQRTSEPANQRTSEPANQRTSIAWKTLGEIGEFIRGNGLQKSNLVEAGFAAIHYGQIHTHYGTWATETKSFVSDVFAVKLRKARSGDLVIATTSEDDEAVAKAVAWIGASEAAVSGDAYIYRHQLEPKYAAYFFQTEQFQDQKKRHITGTKVRRISGESLAKIRIPVPPLEEQERIVAILDKFDALVNDLISGLPAEIRARRLQYEHYRDRLLTFEEIK